MAKPLKKPQSASSMSRFLSPEVALGALEEAPFEATPTPVIAKEERLLKLVEVELRDEPAAVAEPTVTPELVKAEPVTAPFTVVTAEPVLTQVETTLSKPRQTAWREKARELTFTQRTNETLEKLINLFSETTQSRVAANHVVRALFLAAEHGLPEIEKEISALGPLKRPGNESKFNAEREAYEGKLAAALINGLRKARGV